MKINENDTLVKVIDKNNEIAYASDIEMAAKHLNFKIKDIKKSISKKSSLNGFKFQLVDSVTLKPI